MFYVQHLDKSPKYLIQFHLTKPPFLVNGLILTKPLQNRFLNRHRPIPMAFQEVPSYKKMKSMETSLNGVSQAFFYGVSQGGRAKDGCAQYMAALRDQAKVDPTRGKRRGIEKEKWKD